MVNLAERISGKVDSVLPFLEAATKPDQYWASMLFNRHEVVQLEKRSAPYRTWQCWMNCEPQPGRRKRWERNETKDGAALDIYIYISCRFALSWKISGANCQKERCISSPWRCQWRNGGPSMIVFTIECGKFVQDIEEYTSCKEWVQPVENKILWSRWSGTRRYLRMCEWKAWAAIAIDYSDSFCTWSEAEVFRYCVSPKIWRVFYAQSSLIHSQTWQNDFEHECLIINVFLRLWLMMRTRSSGMLQGLLNFVHWIRSEKKLVGSVLQME